MLILRALLFVMLFILYTTVMATLRKELKHFDEETLQREMGLVRRL